MGRRGSLAEGEVVPVNCCTLAPRKSLAVVWEPLQRGRGIDQVQILGRLLEVSQPTRC